MKSLIKNSRDDDVIFAYWWNPKKYGINNWGDALNTVLIQKISGRKPYYVGEDFQNTQNKPVYTVIGSILHQDELTRCGSNLVIWGSGFISSKGRLKAKPKEICAVRGPLSRAILLNQGYSCPEVYGDPALLCPYFYQSRSRKKYELGIIPHYVDKERVPSVICDDPDVLLIDIQGGIEKVVDQICSCKRIASSSLHGVIAADAYHIPSIWIKFSDRVIGDGFKFFDYFSSVGRTDESFLQVEDKTGVEDILDACHPYKLDLNIRKLWESCPFRPE